MNFYKHHIGDYAAATAHLSWDEDMAYTRLLRAYYQHERAIPGDKRAVYRLARASTKQQREAVDAVLEEFFTLEDDGWHQKRCDEEIAELRTLEVSSEERRANEAERQRRHRERRKELFAALREHDIVPKYDTATEALEAILSRVTGGSSNGDVTRDNPDMSRTGHAPATANQTPDTRHQTRALTPASTLGGVTAVASTEAGRACLLMRQAGCITANPSYQPLLDAIAAGVTPEALGHTAAEGVATNKTNPFKWACTTALARLNDGATTPAGTANGTHQPRESLVDRNARRAAEILGRTGTD